MIFSDLLSAWGQANFTQVLNTTLEHYRTYLPLQQGLTHSSYVSDTPLTTLILDSQKTEHYLELKLGILYNGIIAGSCCSDDPSPACEQGEYCEVQLVINLNTAQADVKLLAS